MAALIKPAMPAAAFVWPRLAFIEPMAAGENYVFDSRRARESTSSPVVSPTAVPVPWPSRQNPIPHGGDIFGEMIRRRESDLRE
jgi:hypothetical protein